MNLSSFWKRNRKFLGLLTAGFLFFPAFSLMEENLAHKPVNPALLLRINEVCASNPGMQAEDILLFEDYIELYNPSEEPISLNHLYLSDDKHNYALGALPDDVIAPGSYYLLYATGLQSSSSDTDSHLPFQISAKETLFLSYCEDPSEDPHFLLADSVFIPSLPTASVYARIQDGGNNFAAMRPSPGVSNSTSTLVLPEPTFSAESGFYEEPLSLTLLAPEEFTVRYTLDGSVPSSDSPAFTEPLTLSDQSPTDNRLAAREDIATPITGYMAPADPVDKCVVIRAAAFDEKGNYSNTATAVYFIGFSDKDGYEDIPILSLVAEPEDLFGPEEGIYVRGALYDDAIENILISPDMTWTQLLNYTNYNLSGISSERVAHLDFFGADHSLTLTQECGVRIRGNESRSFPQKSFTLFSRKRYGTDAFAPVFFDSGLSYPNLILNNSTQLKKVFFFSLVEDRNVAVQRFLPCQVFLGGEYWGMYYLMEKYSSEFLEGYYGTSPENVLLIKDSREVQEGNPEDIVRFRNLQEYLEQDLSNPVLYNQLLEQMDMQSFIDWMCTNIYIANTDTKPFGSNVYTWQSVVPTDDFYNDGRWRWMLYDLDDSLGVGIVLPDTPSYAIDSFVEHAGYTSSAFLDDTPMPSLMKNEDFRRQFVLTFMDMANENFEASHVCELLDTAEAEYTKWADKSYARWNETPINLPFTRQVEDLRTFFEHRYDAIVPCLATHFSLEGNLVPLSVSCENAQGGTVSLNTLTLDLRAEAWSGNYYTDYPVTLTAESAQGYHFDRWEVSGGSIVDGTVSSEQIQLQLGDGDNLVRAVFSPTEG